VIRTAKIATIESSDGAKLGRVSASVLKRVMSQVGRELAE